MFLHLVSVFSARSSLDGLRLSAIRGLLSSSILLINANQSAFPSGLAVRDEIISTNRYILILKGRLKYHIEGEVADLRENTLFYVPAWVRRRWGVPARCHCEILWCEFSAPYYEPKERCLFLSRDIDASFEAESLRRILKLWRKEASQFGDQVYGGSPDVWEAAHLAVALELEGELKASLGRFWKTAIPWGKADAPHSPVHPEIKQAVRKIETRYADQDIIESLYSDAKLSRNHFRLIFRSQTGTSPTQYLKNMRLRQARYLLCQTSRPVKDVAAAVGYADPLYFSKQYHSYWGRTPMQDRVSSLKR